jgi:N-acetyl-anhydromuramyl-L-alanine amidase AmpD
MQVYRRSHLSITLFGALCLCPLILSDGVGAAHAKKKSRWKYIVIHHSATRKGNASIMDRYHRNHRHMKNGLAYHFVIDNGTSGRKDGQVEVGRRWREQIPGGHVRQQWLNNCGIGICLVGNFNKQYVSRAQFESLVKLVDRLRKTYGIPISNIRGHGDFGGECTVCPGKRFPMSKLKKRLAELQ